jgi:hypothetical protein
LSSDFLFRRKGKGIACGAVKAQRTFRLPDPEAYFSLKACAKKLSCCGATFDLANQTIMRQDNGATRGKNAGYGAGCERLKRQSAAFDRDDGGL